MAYTNSSLVSYTRISPNRNAPRNNTIQSIVVHHMAGIMSVEQFGELVANPNRQMSANYAIGNDGRIGLFCPESDRSWCSSSAKVDNRAITIEVSNNVCGEPWSISDAAYTSLIKLCVDICKRNGIKKLEYTGNLNGTLLRHCDIVATACPGTWIKNHTTDLCNKVNAQLNAKTETKPESTGYTKTLNSGTPIYKEIGKPATGSINATTKYTIVEEKTVGNIKYGKLKSGAGWVELEKLKRTFNINNVNDVKELQTALNAKGFNCGSVDGDVGKNTTNAMFQALCEAWLQKQQRGYGMLTAEDFAILDDKYVRKDDCNDRHIAQEKEITEIIVQQTKMNTQLGLLVKICAFTAGGIGTLLIGAIGSLILK